MIRTMKQIALALALALSMGAPAALAKTKKPKHSAEHMAAVKKCDADYHEALKEAKSKKGKDRKEAEAAAKSAHKQCMAGAPM